ncbi:TolC family protein [Mucilaginibacter agri]|uniref:TolC family protein n=1 Tax=Mucilaginibacter agri TaxID=2695265 RepID=A0A966DUB8_9SPHI|nr:TolC family protein [Mucilaginibacter agri]NCD72218.1 TolC family protein [Mucilaginibacter agri]
MKYVKYIFAALVICSSVPAFSQVGEADSVYTLQQCIDIAIRNNLDVKKSGLQMDRDRIYWNQARENLIPTLSGDVSRNINNGRSQDPTTYTYVNQQITYDQYGLNSSVVLFNGLNLMNSIKQTSLAYQAGKMDFEQAKNDITLNVITTYLQVLQSEDQESQTETQIEVSKQQVDRLTVLNKEGSISPSDLSDVRGQLATNKISLIDAHNAKYAAKLNLMQLMNVPYNKDVKLKRLPADLLPGQYSLTVDQVYANALTGLPLVKAADLRLKSAEKAVSASKGLYYPSIVLQGGLASNYSSFDSTRYHTQINNNYSYGFSVGLHLPILGNFKTRNNVSLAKIDRLEAQYTTETTKIQLKKNVDQAYINMRSAYERYQTLTDQVDAYSESFRVAETKFNAGVITSVDFITVKGNIDRAKLSLIGARYDYFIRVKILDYYQGKLAL